MTHSPITAMGTTCACHRHRELVPMEDHHIWPLGMGGPDVRSNIVRVCSNAHGAIHFYLALLIKHGGTVPWKTARRYGPAVRELAWRGYQQSRPGT